MTDERLSSSILRKTISEPQTGIELATFWKVAGSIPVWGSEIIFLRIELDEHSSIIRAISNLLHFQKYISHYNNINI